MIKVNEKIIQKNLVTNSVAQCPVSETGKNLKVLLKQQQKEFLFFLLCSFVYQKSYLDDS